MNRILSVGVIFALFAGVAVVMAGETSVEVGHNRLKPAEVSISIGDTVTFHNTDAMPGGHTILADDKSFKSRPLGKDASWSHTFSEAGTFHFHIKQHPGARGKIVVREK